MRFIPTYVHGIADYVAGIVLIAAPWLFGFAGENFATWIPVGVGIVMIVAALFTDYELGAMRRIPMQTHLAMDAGLGILLAVSPWLFGFYELVWVPHFVLGVAEFVGALTTETSPTGRRAGSHYGMG